MEERLLVTVTGPSLTGKTKLANMLRDNGCAELVSTTTRTPRAGEVNGQHYWFLTKEEFAKKKAEDGFIESIEFDGNSYGVSKDEALRAFAKGKPAVVVCEPNGVRQIHPYAQKQGWKTVRVFLNNPSKILVERFLERFKGDSNATAAKYAGRLENMMGKEIREWIEPAVSGKDAYEFVFPEFTPENEEKVLRDVLQSVGLGHNQKAKPRGCAA